MFLFLAYCFVSSFITPFFKNFFIQVFFNIRWPFRTQQKEQSTFYIIALISWRTIAKKKNCFVRGGEKKSQKTIREIIYQLAKMRGELFIVFETLFFRFQFTCHNLEQRWKVITREKGEATVIVFPQLFSIVSIHPFFSLLVYIQVLIIISQNQKYNLVWDEATILQSIDRSMPLAIVGGQSTKKKQA